MAPGAQQIVPGSQSLSPAQHSKRTSGSARSDRLDQPIAIRQVTSKQAIPRLGSWVMRPFIATTVPTGGRRSRCFPDRR